MKHPLTIQAAARALKAGSLTPVDLAGECLERIAMFEPALSAWAVVDAEGAASAAQQLTEELRNGHSRGRLHGIPLGIKDIVDVAGLPTRAASALTDDVPATADAPVVARLRAAGALILGKTVTTEFACFDPPPTRNPWNPACTPGGSSSGSAAAVAAGMCLGAIGTQTGGSITRPASYCGIAGVKPTFGRVARDGVLPVSDHLDHVGPMARTAADCELLLRAILERGGDEPPRGQLPPRLGCVRPYFIDTADPETAELTLAAIGKLADAGATIVELPLPDDFDAVHAMHARIMYRECAEFHRHAFGAPRHGYGPRIAELIDDGLRVTDDELAAALAHQRAFRDLVAKPLAEVDAVVVPSTPGPAGDPSTTGDARFNSPWSYAGVPTVSIPCGLVKAGLPVSLQLVGRADSDLDLLGSAVWCEQQLGFQATRPLLAKRAETR